MPCISKELTRTTIAIACALVLSVSACNKAAGAPPSVAANGDAANAKDARVSACSLLTQAEISEITSLAITVVDGDDDGRSTQSGCHYWTARESGVGVVLDIHWISPRDYSDPAEHAALQKAMIGGATLGGKLTTEMPGASRPGMHAGAVDGVGEEATQAMLLLTARKGDYSVMVQIIPLDLQKVLTDSTVAIALQEQEKTIARRTLAKL
jgi:hypothetical protein